MLPFVIELSAGAPIYEQIVEAVRRAVASGRMKPGDRFPSLRTISTELRVNPNTVQKAVTELTSQGLLEVRSGQGCFITEKPAVTVREQCDALAPILERLAIEAAHLGVDEVSIVALLRVKCRELKINLNPKS